MARLIIVWGSPWAGFGELGAVGASSAPVGTLGPWATQWILENESK